MANSIKAMRVLVSGTVQGVYFRRSTLLEATDLNLKGWVRNLNDGRVECKVVGPEDDLLTLLHWMGRGPVQAKVERVDVEWLSAQDDFWTKVPDGFVIETTAKLS